MIRTSYSIIQQVWLQFLKFNYNRRAIYRVFHDLWTLLEEVIS